MSACSGRAGSKRIAAAVTRRSVQQSWRPARSIPSGDSRRYPLRCPHGNIRKRGSNRASADRSGIILRAAEYRTPPIVSRRKILISRREISAATCPDPFVPRARRALHLEIFAKIMVKLLQRFDQQIVHRKPDRPPPVRISAEQTGRRFGRLVVHAACCAVHAAPRTDGPGDTAKARERRTAKEIPFSSSMRLQHPPQLLAVHQRQAVVRTPRADRCVISMCSGTSG